MKYNSQRNSLVIYNMNDSPLVGTFVFFINTFTHFTDQKKGTTH